MPRGVKGSGVGKTPLRRLGLKPSGGIKRTKVNKKWLDPCGTAYKGSILARRVCRAKKTPKRVQSKRPRLAPAAAQFNYGKGPVVPLALQSMISPDKYAGVPFLTSAQMMQMQRQMIEPAPRPGRPSIPDPQHYPSQEEQKLRSEIGKRRLSDIAARRDASLTSKAPAKKKRKIIVNNYPAAPVEVAPVPSFSDPIMPPFVPDEQLPVIHEDPVYYPDEDIILDPPLPPPPPTKASPGFFRRAASAVGNVASTVASSVGSHLKDHAAKYLAALAVYKLNQALHGERPTAPPPTLPYPLMAGTDERGDFVLEPFGEESPSQVLAARYGSVIPAQVDFPGPAGEEVYSPYQLHPDDYGALVDPSQERSIPPTPLTSEQLARLVALDPGVTRVEPYDVPGVPGVVPPPSSWWNIFSGATPEPIDYGDPAVSFAERSAPVQGLSLEEQRFGTPSPMDRQSIEAIREHLRSYQSGADPLERVLFPSPPAPRLAKAKGKAPPTSAAASPPPRWMINEDGSMTDSRPSPARKSPVTSRFLTQALSREKREAAEAAEEEERAWDKLFESEIFEETDSGEWRLETPGRARRQAFSPGAIVSSTRYVPPTPASEHLFPAARSAKAARRASSNAPKKLSAAQEKKMYSLRQGKK